MIINLLGEYNLLGFWAHRTHVGPCPGIQVIPECVMSPSTSQLLTSVYEAVRDLEERYGANDQGVVYAKRVLVACLRSVRLIETPEEARLFNSAHTLVYR